MRLLLQLDFDFDLEYGDYECPYTGMAYPVVKEIMREFGDDKICFVFRNFPLNDIHPHAQHAAEAIESVAGKIKTRHL